MNLSSEDLFDILVSRVSDDMPHADYQRTVDHAKWCKQIVTGDDQKEILITYKVRETQKQVEQRIRITNSRTQYVSNKVKKLYNEVHRCDDVVESISYNGNKDEEKVKQLTAALDVWHENKPLKKYISNRFKDLVFEDPNAYVIVEFENDDPINKKPTVYPFEVRSSEVYDPYYVNGVLKHLITFHPLAYKTSTNTVVIGNKYTMYGIGWSFVMKHIPEDVNYVLPEGWGEMYMKYGSRNGENNRFVYAAFETKSKECPAFRVGFIDDPETNGRTKVSPMNPAKHILTDLMWNKSEYDMSKALHGFIKMFMYVDKCKTCEGDGNISGVACNTCKGSGKQMHTTTQDVVLIDKPADGSPMEDLSKYIHLAEIPDTLIQRQREDFQTDQKDVFNAIFGANVLDRTEIVETATAKHYDWRAVNNTLFEYADQVAEFYKFSVRVSANHRAEGEGLIIQYSVPSDFKLESIEELLSQRGQALGGPMEIVSNINLTILGKQHKDNPQFLKNYRAKEQWRPMRDKSDQERMILLTSGLPQDDSERILYLYFERIMDDIFDETPQFADLKYKKQREIVYGKVSDIKLSMVKPNLSMALAGAAVTDDEDEEMMEEADA